MLRSCFAARSSFSSEGYELSIRAAKMGTIDFLRKQMAQQRVSLWNGLKIL